MSSDSLPLYKTVLQVTPERIAVLTDADLTALMDSLIRAQVYRCGADIAQVCVNTEGRASDAGCDGWSPKPPSDDPWLADAETCWQFKAGTAGEPSRIRGEVSKRIPADTLKVGGRFVVVASASVSGKKGEDDRLNILRRAALDAGLPTDKIQVFGSEKLTAWCNEHPSIAARWAGRPAGLAVLSDWERSEEHRVPWHPSDDQRGSITRLHSELEFSVGSVVHLHVEGPPGVGKTRFTLELCRQAPWRDCVIYVRQATDVRLAELLDSAVADPPARLLVVADEVQSDQLRPLNESVRRGEGRIRLITIGHCHTPDPRQIPAIRVTPLGRQAMAEILGHWYPGMPTEHVEFVVRFADGYVRLARL